jgi:hypothetical protein
MRRFIALLMTLTLATPAAACVNGWDLPSEEQEFRSQYGTKPTPQPSDESRSEYSGGLLAGLAAVGIAAAGAFTLKVHRPRA